MYYKARPIKTSDFAWMERRARRQLGLKEFKSDPTCGNYQYIRRDCDNTNLDADGFCQFCDHYHWQIHFGKKHKSNATRADAGCNSFGDGGQNNQFGSELLFIGTEQPSSTTDVLFSSVRSADSEFNPCHTDKEIKEETRDTRRREAQAVERQQEAERAIYLRTKDNPNYMPLVRVAHTLNIRRPK